MELRFCNPFHHKGLVLMNQMILKDIPSLCRVFAGQKTLLVCDPFFEQLPLAKDLAVLNPVRFSGFSSNPLYEDVCRGVQLFRKEECSAIVAVGGGSSLDVAKCIKLFAAMDPEIHYLKQPYPDSPVPLAAIPTTAGTGSEATRHAVIYFNGEKQSISHTGIIPNYICMIPGLLDTLPLYQKKCTMLDALCQAIESWWSVNSTEESVQFSRQAITAIRDHWKEYLDKGTPDASEHILMAAYHSGRAINITATTAAHAMSYKLTSLYRIPHGHAVALCMQKVWEYMLHHTEECIDPRGETHLNTVFAELPVDLDWFLDLMKALNMDRLLSGNRKEELDILAASVNPVRLKNNPVALQTDTLRAMYNDILL